MYFFLSVLSLCAFALTGFTLHLYRRPAITPDQLSDLIAKVEKLEQRLNKLNLSGR